MQAEDGRASFLFVCDLNGHNQEWLGSTTTNRHGVAAFDYATVFFCNLLVVGPTHACGGTVDLRMIVIPDLEWVVVVAPIRNSHHSSLTAPFRWLRLFQTCVLGVSGKVFLKHQVNWKTVCGEIQDLLWCNIWSTDKCDNPVEVLIEHFLILVGTYVPTMFIHSRKKD